MRAVKLVALFSVVFLASACSSLSTGDQQVAAKVDAYGDVKTIEMQTRIARLQTENAGLAQRVLELKRENERLNEGATATAAAAESPVQTDEFVDAPTPSGPMASLREPASLPKAVVDNPDAPDIEKSDVPVETSPRLTQPTFAATDAVFENESGAKTSDNAGLFGVHLASYRKAVEARQGWGKLQRENPDQLGLLEPRIEVVEIPDKGRFLRLIGGGFSSRDKAEALCTSLKQRGLYCSVSQFSGERLSLSGTG